MVCIGRRCPYRFCELPDHLLPSAGTLCPWETDYACHLAEELHNLFEDSLLRTKLDEHTGLMREHVVASLLANRACVRLSRAMEEVTVESFETDRRLIDRKPFEHFALAMRYLTAAHNRTKAVWQTIDELSDEARAKHRAERIRSEMLQAGYWNPLKGDEPPVIEDAPDWIVEKVDRECGDGQRLVGQDSDTDSSSPTKK